jgi:hypothetical protein
MSTKDFKLTDAYYNIFSASLKRCGDCVDINGWRYDKEMGMEEYTPIDIDDPFIQYQFIVCISFLKTYFPSGGPKDTVSSFDLREGCELWWFKKNNEKVYIDTGVLLVALVACGLAPKNLWFSMECNQKARIPLQRWQVFCEENTYTTQVIIKPSSESSADVIKIT